MNSKQKLGYTILGAAIMIVGMGIGAIVSPNLIAQSDGEWNHFDHVTCRSLTVADGNGLLGVRLVAGDGDHGANGMCIFDKSGEVVVALLWTDVTGSMLATTNNTKTFGILLTSNDERNSVEVYSPPEGDKGVGLFCSKSERGVQIDGYAGKEEIRLQTAENIDPFIAIEDRAGRVQVIRR